MYTRKSETCGDFRYRNISGKVRTVEQCSLPHLSQTTSCRTERGCGAAVPWSALCRNVLWTKGKWHVSQLRISLHSSHRLAMEKADVKTPCVSLQELLLTVIFRKTQPDSSQVPLILLTSIVYLTLSEPASWCKAKLLLHSFCICDHTCQTHDVWALSFFREATD